MDTVVLADVAGADLPVLFHHVGATDPGALGANRVWLDTTGGNVALKVRNAANTGWLRLGLAKADLVHVRHNVVTGTVASSANTAAWSEHLATTRVLPAGTWDVTTMLFGTYTSNTANSGLAARIILPVAGGDTSDGVPTVFSRVSLFTSTFGSVVSDGVAATTFRAEYRPTTASTAYAYTANLIALCVRTG